MKSGDIVVIQPHDPDDCEALAHAGERCQLLRYVESAFGVRYAVVRFSSKGRPFYFRSEDLAEALEPSATAPENLAPAGPQTEKAIV